MRLTNLDEREFFRSVMAWAVRKGDTTSLCTSSSKRSMQASMRKARGGKRWWTSSAAVGSRMLGCRRPWNYEEL